MGCGASTQPEQGNTRFTNTSLYNLTGLRFNDPPPCTTDTTGIHPDCARLDAKRRLSNVIRTNEGGLLVRAAPGTTVDCLLLYPEYTATEEPKGPPKSFGLGIETAASRVQSEKDKRLAVKGAHVESSSDTDDDDGLFDQSVHGLLARAKKGTAGTASAAKGKIAQGFSALGFGNFMTMEDADDDDLSAPPPQKQQQQQQHHQTPHSPPQADPGDPRWVAAVCQFKEFDSLDDVAKPWHRSAGGGVPGVLRLESAGRAGAWATLEPHQYQQRWALPDGDRVACFTDDSPSIPQRILAAYRACGGDKYVRELIERVQAVRRAIPEELLLAAFDAAETAIVVTKNVAGAAGQAYGNTAAAAEASAAADKMRQMMVAAERARNLDVDGIVASFNELMSDEGLGSMGSVYDLPPALDDLKAILGYVEDSLLYNWIEVAVEADIEVGTNYFLESDKGAKRHTEWRVWDTLLRKFLEEANELADEAFAALKEQLGIITRVCLLDAFDGDASGGAAAFASDAAQRQIEALFPDLPDMVRMDAASIDTEMLGVHLGFDDDDSVPRQPPREEIPDLIRQWRQEDARPLEARRQEVYDRETARIARYVETHAGEMERIAELGEQTRLPIPLPRRFHEFEFILLFPRQLDHPGVRRPTSARLCIWPEGCLQLEQKVNMADFTLDNGGPTEENALIEKAADMYDDGDDTVDTATDPRRQWVEYPSPEWRGFKCTVEVPIGLTHDFNFELDGVVFLDHNSFSEGEKGKEYFRRIRFREVARPFTFNPLRELGIVA